MELGRLIEGFSESEQIQKIESILFYLERIVAEKNIRQVLLCYLDWLSKTNSVK